MPGEENVNEVTMNGFSNITPLRRMVKQISVRDCEIYEWFLVINYNNLSDSLIMVSDQTNNEGLEKFKWYFLDKTLWAIRTAKERERKNMQIFV